MSAGSADHAVDANANTNATDRERYAVLAPGQGRQKAGVLRPWLELDGAHDQLSRWSQRCDLDLVALGTTVDSADLVDTAVAQPLVVAASLVAYRYLGTDSIPLVTGSAAEIVVAGHSVGEVSALAIAGVLDPDDAVALAAVRGRAMAQACAEDPTGMSAVLGGDEERVLERLAELGLCAANRNAAGQIVAAGRRDALARLREEPPPDAKVVPLRVAGAFHTDYMRSARDVVERELAHCVPRDPNRILVSNRDGSVVTSGIDAVERIATQITSPVRWDLCLRTMKRLAVGAMVELPPAGALAPIARRELPEVEVSMFAAADVVREGDGGRVQRPAC